MEVIQMRILLAEDEKDSITDRVKGLDSGANDYLVKPFSFGSYDSITIHHCNFIVLSVIINNNSSVTLCNVFCLKAVTRSSVTGYDSDC